MARNRSKSNASSSSSAPAKKLLTHDEYKDEGLAYTTREVGKLWRHLEANPSEINKTKHFQNKVKSAGSSYTNLLKSVSPWRRREALRVTGHEGYYYFDIIVFAFLFAAGGIIMYYTA
jgi:hypothetical protein